MDETDRRDLLGRLRRPSRTIGGSIPDELTVQGTTIALREFVFECERLETIPPSERERIEETKRQLQRERLRRKRRLERADITYEEGEELVESVLGIDRAVNALESLDEPDLGEQLRQEQVEKARELLSLMRQSE